MTDARSARPAAETAIRDQGDLVTQSHAHDGGGRREHLLHPGSALWAFVTNNNTISSFDFSTQDSGHSIFLRLKNYCRTFELHHGLTDAAHLHHRALGCQVAKQNGQPTALRMGIFISPYNFIVLDVAALD